ncbi:PRC-barrel domain-containing protein [Desulfovibrio inopinatus]|uniref:PRC-barrel domain containing protein n=1 Tax=Desulfovibrio inopinatus TaxID=102109 RepID=UPI00040FA5FB|nr:PRC-barrel domain-containing protein [Desulfovibrio inopinatus]
MEIAIGAEVVCTDGIVGTVKDILLSPVAGKLTHVVVREDESPNHERLVPARYLKKADHERLDIALTREKFQTLKDFLQSEFISPEVFVRLAKQEHVDLPIVPAGWTIDYEAIPPGDVIVRKGEDVYASDGHVGRVDEFVLEGRSGRVTHLVLKEGHFFGSRIVSVPARHIASYEDGKIMLSIDKQTVEGLEEFIEADLQ